MLILIFAFNIVGVMAVFKLQQLQIRREIKRQIKRGLQEDELHVIIIQPENSSDLDWQDESEFMYRGSMFDIVKSETRTDNSIVYYCINDNEEKALFANLDDLVKKQIRRNFPANQKVAKILKYFSPIQVQSKNELVMVEQTFSKLMGLYINNYISFEISIESPPPKYFSFLA